MPKILFVGSRGRLFESGYRREPDGWQIEAVEDLDAAAVLLLAVPVELVIADLNSEDEERRLVELVRTRCPRAPVIGLGRAGSLNARARNILEGVRAGLNTPVNKELLATTLDRLNQPISRHTLNSAVEYLNQPISGRDGAPRTRVRVHTQEDDVSSPLIGPSSAMRQVRERIRAVGRSDCPVLIVGESGTGKELAARAIHEAGSRAAMPFIAVNCASLPDELLESELFGHAKGAFSGASRDRKGLLEEASGGTFLLDEVLSASPAIQAKLLRFLESKTFRRLGDNRELSCDVRVLACSNCDLDEMARNGRFRADLLFRLDVIRVELPPLRERLEDIPALVSHFLSEFESRYPGQVRGASLEYQQWLSRHDFPGNVRELKNLIEAGLVMSRGGVLGPDDLPERLRRPESQAEDDAQQVFRQRLASYERDLIEEALRKNADNLDATAHQLGMGRTTLWRRMTEYGLTRIRRQS